MKGSVPCDPWASKTLHIAGKRAVRVTDAADVTLNESKFTMK